MSACIAEYQHSAHYHHKCITSEFNQYSNYAYILLQLALQWACIIPVDFPWRELVVDGLNHMDRLTTTPVNNASVTWDVGAPKGRWRKSERRRWRGKVILALWQTIIYSWTHALLHSPCNLSWPRLCSLDLKTTWIALPLSRVVKLTHAPPAATKC